MTDHSDWEFFQDEGYFGMWCVREKGARRFGEGFHTVSKEEAEALASALSSQSLSLSEAREEIERLTKERDAIRQEAHEVVLSMIFMPGVRKALDALPEDDPVEPYIARIRELEAKEARLAALENCKPALADATPKSASSDLSSLRKGAEVAVKPLEWDLSGMARGYPAKAVSIFGNYTAWEIEDGFWMPPEAHCGRRAGVGLQSALDAAQLDFETRIRSALVSGSREDGNG